MFKKYQNKQSILLVVIIEGVISPSFVGNNNVYMLSILIVLSIGAVFAIIAGFIQWYLLW